MFFRLTKAVKRRIMWELKDAFKDDPDYSKIVPFIQLKHVFDERPQYGIVINSASMSTQRLSPDNFVGTIISHAMLAKVDGHKGLSVEWVSEDLQAIRDNDGVFPAPSGVYFVEVVKAPELTDKGWQPGSFIVDPMVNVVDEKIITVTNPAVRTAYLTQRPVEGTLTLWLNRNTQMIEDQEYEVDYTTKEIHFLRALERNDQVFATYRYSLQTVGPIELEQNRLYHEVIPGVVLSFGRRIITGDRQAVVVTESRVETAKEYGGQTEVSVDFDVIARDTDQMEDISDLVFMFLWGERSQALLDDGLQVLDLSHSGETEETYDETGEEFYYNTSFSMSIRSSWSIFVPMPLTFKGLTYMSGEAQSAAALLTSDQLARIRSSIVMDKNLGLTSSSRVILKDLTWDYERPS